MDLLVKRGKDTELSTDDAEDTKYHKIENKEECWPEQIVPWLKSNIYFVKQSCVNFQEHSRKSYKHSNTLEDSRLKELQMSQKLSFKCFLISFIKVYKYHCNKCEVTNVKFTPTDNNLEPAQKQLGDISSNIY